MRVSKLPNERVSWVGKGWILKKKDYKLQNAGTI